MVYYGFHSVCAGIQIRYVALQLVEV